MRKSLACGIALWVVGVEGAVIGGLLVGLAATALGPEWGGRPRPALRHLPRSIRSTNHHGSPLNKDLARKLVRQGHLPSTALRLASQPASKAPNSKARAAPRTTATSSAGSSPTRKPSIH